jgi:hypothetical protein
MIGLSVFNATFNNIFVVTRLSILLVEATVTREHDQPVESN